MNGESEAVRRAVAPALRPSEYTAALIHALQADTARVRGASVLEIGSGSGVVLAALGALGAGSVCGVDIEQEAVETGGRLLRRLGHAAEVHCGDMWLPVAGRRFDLIVANLPHFPMEPVPVAGRLPTWSSGGADGRWLLDAFLEGLPIHLASDGRAMLTHNAFVGLERSHEIARENRIGTAFLERQQQVWQRPECDTPEGSANSACVLAALNLELKPTPFAGPVEKAEDWIEKRLGIDVTLPMLKTAPAFSLFLNGVVNSLILIAGALTATFAFAIVFGFLLGSEFRPLRWAARLVTMTLQSSPIVLTLVIAAGFAHALLPYSAGVALGASILALGLTNGSNAGQAVSEAVISLHHEGREKGKALFVHALGRSAVSIVAFLINAAKGTPAASFIGAPELLSALTDVSSFSSGRATVYCLVLIFYTAVVMIVVWACGWLRAWLEGREVPA